MRQYIYEPKHIRESMERIVNSSKAKFFIGNEKHFVRHFTSSESYHAKIEAGRFDEIRDIIKAGTDFDKEEFCLAFGNNLKEIE